MFLQRVPRILDRLFTAAASQAPASPPSVKPVRTRVLEQYAAHFDQNGLATTRTGRLIALNTMQEALNSFLERLETPLWGTKRQIKIRVAGYYGGIREGRARLGLYRPEGENYHQASSLQKCKRRPQVFGQERASLGYARPSDIDLTVDYDGEIDFIVANKVINIAEQIFEEYGVLIEFALLTNYRSISNFPHTQSPIAELHGNGLKDRLLPLI